MDTSDNLLKMIHLLTASEKKYFKQYITTRKDSKFYAALFDQLAKQEEYDAPLLARKLKKTTKQISDAKAYLQRVLMKALEAYHAESTPQLQILHLTAQAEVAWMKSVLPLATELLDRAETIATQHDLFILLVSIYRQRQIICAPTYDYDTLQGLNLKITHYLALEKNLHDYRQLHRELGRLALPARDKGTTAHIDAYRQHPLLQSEDTALSLSARALYHRILIVYHFWYGERGEAYLSAMRLYDVVQQERARLDLNPTIWSACLVDILTGLQADRSDRTVFLEVLSELDTVAARISTSNRMQYYLLWAGACQFRQTHYVAMGLFDEGVRYYYQFVRTEEYRMLSDVGRSLILFETALCFYHTGRSDMALKLIHEIEEMKVRILSTGVTFMRLRVLLAMMACDDRNIVTMRSQLAAARRHIKNHEPHLASLRRMEQVMTQVIERRALSASEVEALLHKKKIAKPTLQPPTMEEGFHFDKWLLRQVGKRTTTDRRK